MADTGWKDPGTMATVDRDGKTHWLNPDNAKASDDADAMSTFAATYNDWLRATNFGFAVPVGATIDGVIVSIEKQAGLKTDSSIRLRTDADGQIGDDKATGDAWPAADTYVEHGGAADDWNALLDVNDVNHANFGVDISAASSGIGTARVDHIRIKVFYTEGGGGDADKRAIMKGVLKGVL